MSKVHLSTVQYPAAPIGPENPLPPLAFTTDLHDKLALDGLSEEMQRNIVYGKAHSILPYRVQDGYGRTLELTDHQVAVVENDKLRATFLPGLGGRLWSLVDLATGREILYSNKAIQPGNLGLRDAWFAGGVEWNIGTTGHTPLTSSPLHAARVVLDDGTEVLRMYEYERSRELIYQVDAWLPTGSASLLVAVRVTNPNDHEVPLYWWSNTAVPEHEGTRVVVDADSAWQFDYDSGLRSTGFPVTDGVDRSYTTRSDAAADYFFDLQGAQHPWIAALDDSGTGLLQSSTSELQGRKLFLWGHGQGGRHWQEWLSPLGGQYLEIQAGLARTQLEHLPLPAHSTRSWTESYGLLSVDPSAVHGQWEEARRAAGVAVEKLIPAGWLSAQHRLAEAFADREPSETLQVGSGWGALERRRRRTAGETWSGTVFNTAGTPFPDSTLGPEQEQWLELLDHGSMTGNASSPPSSYAVSSGWLALLEDVPGWLGALHRGMALAYSGDTAGAVRAWQASHKAEPNAWALRNQAVLTAQSDARQASALYEQAIALAPLEEALLLEYVEFLQATETAEEVLRAVDALPVQTRRSPRGRLVEAAAAVSAQDAARAGTILDTGLVLPQLREGARMLADLWYNYRALRLANSEGAQVTDRHRAAALTEALPWMYDFGMTPVDSDPDT